MSDLTIFAFESAAVRTLMIDGEPWFVAADIANVLDYRNAYDMTRMLDDDEKGTHIMRTPGGDQEMTIINESGLYSCILRSRKPEAKVFRKWVTAEVLPSIRKTGGYGELPPAVPASPFIASGNPAHAADLMVSADRTFRAVMRSSRTAGLNMAESLRCANAIVIQRTGLDLLECLGVEVQEAAPHESPFHNSSVTAFAREWVNGSLPVSFRACKSSDLYEGYLLWCHVNNLDPAGQRWFFEPFLKAAPEVLKSNTTMTAPGRHRKTLSVRVIVPKSHFHAAINEPKRDFLSRSIGLFQSELAGWKAQVYG